jgi:hypothetical protein
VAWQGEVDVARNVTLFAAAGYLDNFAWVPIRKSKTGPAIPPFIRTSSRKRLRISRPTPGFAPISAQVR